jgi:single-strand DNA-binding protein
MANSMNLCLFTGNLGQDPEVRYSQSGVAVANVSLALSGRKKSGDKWEDKTEWVNLVAIGKRAEVLRDYAHKGSKIRVTSEVQVRKWTDKEGRDRYTTEFLISDLELLTPKAEGQQQAPRQQAAPQQRPTHAGSKQAPQQEQGDDDFDDDIPFNWEAA